MTSYFIKFMLLLMVTLSISQANATVVYYKNTNSWETPTAHMWRNESKSTTWPGTKMDNLGGGWYSIDAVYRFPKMCQPPLTSMANGKP